MTYTYEQKLELAKMARVPNGVVNIPECYEPYLENTAIKECYLETFSNMVAANKFYKKHEFIQLDKPIVETEHYACDAWYIKSLFIQN